MTSRPLSLAMNLSLATGVAMLGVKWYAYALTGSSVIFSDAAESVVHVGAVWFAWYAVRETGRPPDHDHHYGHDKISYVSAGVEGGLICVAALIIIGAAIQNLVVGVSLERLDFGMVLTGGAGAFNALLGLYLVRVGKREGSLAVEANGKHVMTDAWTSAGAVLGLLAAQFTGWHWLDPVFAVLFGANIIREGLRLMRLSIDGLMDKADPKLYARADQIIARLCIEHDCTYHRLRLRTTGNAIHIDYHLLVPDDMRMQDAHTLATIFEDTLCEALGIRCEVFTHLESTTQPPGHV